MTLGLYGHLYSNDLTKVAESLDREVMGAVADPPEGWTAVRLRYRLTEI
jgi:hypothetical protein